MIDQPAQSLSMASLAKLKGRCTGGASSYQSTGFMPDPVAALTQGKAIKTVLVDGEDLILVLENHLSLTKSLAM